MTGGMRSAQGGFIAKARKQILEDKWPTASPSVLDVALGAVGFGFKRRSGGIVTGSAGGLGSLGGLVQAGFEIKRRFGLLSKQFVVAGFAIAVGPRDVRGVIEGHVPILCCKCELFRRFLSWASSPNAPISPEASMQAMRVRIR